MSWRKVSANALDITISTAALALLQWLVMAFVARIDGPTMLGHYTLAQSFATPASYLAWLAMRQQYIASREDGAAPEDFMLLRILLPAVVFALLLVFIRFYYASALLLTVSMGVFAVKYAEGFFDLIYGRMQQSGATRAVATTSVVRCTLSLAVFGVIYYWSHDLAGGLYAITAIWLVMFVWQRKRLWPFVDPRGIFASAPGRLGRLLNIVVSLSPLALSLTMMSFTVNAPRFLLDHILGPADLGFFAAAYHFLALGSVIIGSLGHSLLPGLSAAVKRRDARSFWKQLVVPALLMQLLALVGAVVAAFIGSSVLRIVYGPSFAPYGNLLVWSAAAAGPFYGAALLANGLHAAQLKRSLLAAQFISLFCVVVATWVLASRYGIPGGFAAICVAALGQGLFSVARLRSFLGSF